MGLWIRLLNKMTPFYSHPLLRHRALLVGLSIFFVFGFVKLNKTNAEMGIGTGLPQPDSSSVLDRPKTKSIYGVGIIDLESRMAFVREKLTPKKEGPYWTPSDFPHIVGKDQKLVPYHTSVSDLIKRPLSEWIKTQYRSSSHEFGHQASLFLRPPDWLADYRDGMSASHIELRGYIPNKKIGRGSYGVWASIKFYLQDSPGPDGPLSLPWKSDHATAEPVTFSDGSHGFWEPPLPYDKSNDNPHSIYRSSLMVEKFYRFSADGKYVLNAELAANYPRETDERLDPAAQIYYHETFKSIFGSLNPQPIELPKPKVITIKNCQLEPYWSELTYGSTVTFRNFDRRSHTLFNVDLIGRQEMKFTIPAKSEKDYFVDPFMVGMLLDISCDTKTSKSASLMTPTGAAGYIFVPYEYATPGDTVTIKNCRPFPYQLKVQNGDTVHFVNEDGKAHILHTVFLPPPPHAVQSYLTFPPSPSSITSNLPPPTIFIPSLGKDIKLFVPAHRQTTYIADRISGDGRVQFECDKISDSINMIIEFPGQKVKKR